MGKTTTRRPPKLAKDELFAQVAQSVTEGTYVILPHARQRCTERDVAAPDIEEALSKGRYTPRRDRYDEDLCSWSYCFEGRAVDGDRLRVVVAFEDWMLVVTVVRLDGGWED